MSHLTLPLWCTVPLNRECLFGKSLKMAMGMNGAGLFSSGGGDTPLVVKL